MRLLNDDENIAFGMRFVNIIKFAVEFQQAFCVLFKRIVFKYMTKYLSCNDKYKR